MPEAPLRITLVSEGTSDRALLRVIRWLFRHRGFIGPIEESWADIGRFRSPPKTLAEKIRLALLFYPCDVLFVHRDSDGYEPASRAKEIAAAIPSDCHCVPVIPVRMLEAWLLFDEELIRAAAGNPLSKAELELPPLNRVESIADPKSMLLGLLRRASGLSGRRLAKFNSYEARFRIAELAEDFSPLFALAAFRELDEQIRGLIP